VISWLQSFAFDRLTLCRYVKNACVPNNVKLIGLNTTLAAGWMAAAAVVGFVMVRIVAPTGAAE
jgi:hypothetical protein